MRKTCVIHNNFTETHVHPAFHPVGNDVACDDSISFTGWQWLPGDGNTSGSNSCDIELWSSRRNWRWGERREEENGLFMDMATRKVCPKEPGR